MVEKARIDFFSFSFSIIFFSIHFWISSYYTLLFPRRDNLKFFEVALTASHLFFTMVWLAAFWICESIGIEILPIPQRKFTYFSKNGHKSTQTMCKVCSNPKKSTTTIDFRLASVFVINLEQLLHPTLVLLKTWKGKCWLKVRRELFVKIIQWCCYDVNKWCYYGNSSLFFSLAMLEFHEILTYSFKIRALPFWTIVKFSQFFFEVFNKFW